MSNLPVILTSSDHALLESLIQRWIEPFEGATAYVRNKLARAALIFPFDLPHNVVTLRSRVRFLPPGGTTEDRMLVRHRDQHVDGMTVLLESALGLALLGAQAGQVIEVMRRDGAVRPVFLESVTCRPLHQSASPALRVVT